MKRSGYLSIFHIYLIFFVSSLCVLLLAGWLLFGTFAVELPDGRVVRSDWPRVFAEDFKGQILFVDEVPQIKPEGIDLLQAFKAGIQILDASGSEVFRYQTPEGAPSAYTGPELLRLCKDGRLNGDPLSVFSGSVCVGEKEFVYLMFFPVGVSGVTMYVNESRFSGGKAIVLPIVSVLVAAVLLSGVLYGLFITGTMKRLVSAIEDIASRRYTPVQRHGVFQDLYGSFNALDEKIRASEHLREQTEKLRNEWIANITHDLKTPLSPIKGYAEILKENGGEDPEQRIRYGEIVLKNVSYMERLIDDLKLTYQLKNGMLPLNREERNIVRFLRELAIDILNSPDYEKRIIHFESNAEDIPFSFDQTLLTRAFRNLIINAFVHGDEATEVILRVSATETALTLQVADNGKGIDAETLDHLFDRYYRGVDTRQKPEGTGLGLAIARDILELHGGTLCVFSTPAVGTTFEIHFPGVKVH